MATAINKLYSRLSQNKLTTLASLTHNSFRKNGTAWRSSLNEKQLHTCSALLATTKINMPSLSPTMEKGNIVKWHKKEGDTVSPGDALCDIETDKAVISMDTEESGILAKIITPDNTPEVVVGALIALLVEEGEDWKSVEIPARVVNKVLPASTLTAPAPVAVKAEVSAVHGESGHLMGPAVKKLLQEFNISSASITPTGPAGALLKSDVLNYIQSKNLNKVVQQASALGSSAPAPGSSAPSGGSVKAVQVSNYTDIPLSNMRRTIAKRLTESKTTIPHAYASIDSNMGSLLELRKALTADGVKVSVNDFIVKAAAIALQRAPKVNAIWANDGPRFSQSVDISVAVATPNGLITPIVKSASYLSVEQISNTIKELSVKAKEGKLLPHEFQGGSFSISNLGMFGITEFTAVINPPQLGILAVGTSRSEVTMLGTQQKMIVTLSYDSRGINEVEATRFLEEFRNVIENPQCMLSGTKLDAAAEAFAF